MGRAVAIPEDCGQSYWAIKWMDVGMVLRFLLLVRFLVGLGHAACWIILCFCTFFKFVNLV